MCSFLGNSSSVICGICTASVALAPVAGACAYLGAKVGGGGYLIARYS